MGAFKRWLKATLCNSCTIIYNCALLWPLGPFCYAETPQERTYFSLTWAENAEKISEFFRRSFVLQFPGKVCARTSTKNHRQSARAMKQNSFTARLWKLGGTTFCKREFSSLNDDNCRQLWTSEDKYPKPPFRLSRYSSFKVKISLVAMPRKDPKPGLTKQTVPKT